MGRSGATLPDLATAFLVVGVIAAMGMPVARSWADRTALTWAREEAVALFAQARREAVAHGGAILRFDGSQGTGALVLDGQVMRQVDFREGFGVEVDPGGSDGRAELQFDHLGLGQVASRTIRFQRGGEVRELLVSSYGRVRRR